MAAIRMWFEIKHMLASHLCILDAAAEMVLCSWDSSGMCEKIGKNIQNSQQRIIRYSQSTQGEHAQMATASVSLAWNQCWVTSRSSRSNWDFCARSPCKDDDPPPEIVVHISPDHRFWEDLAPVQASSIPLLYPPPHKTERGKRKKKYLICMYV